MSHGAKKSSEKTVPPSVLLPIILMWRVVTDMFVPNDRCMGNIAGFVCGVSV